MPTNTMIWFRKGLRLHDNPALLKAADGADALYPVFCLDPWFISSGRIGPNRINFLLEALSDLDASLRARSSRLIVLRGNPRDVLPAAMEAWGVSRLCFEHDTEPYALERDAAMRAAAKKMGVEVHSPVSHTLYDTDALIAKNNGKAPNTMTAFEKLVGRMGNPPKPVDAPESLPAVHDSAPSHKADWLVDDGAVPTLQGIGLELEEANRSPFRGGETEALKRLEKYMAREDWVCAFEKPKGNPAAFDPEPATTVLSPYLKFGCLSPRLFHARLLEIYGRSKSHTKPPTSLRGQLLWREFFYTVGYDTPNFENMEGNPEIRQIPWDDDPEFLDAWENGRTGYPWIDAIMNQLRTWGWMHHLARHSVACFLTRGDLWCHWERGRDVFDKYLIDGDHFINNGNWQWLSASNFFYQYFRVYSPVAFGKKYDPTGAYVRQFVPVLKDFPAKYIYEPWTAPLEVQKKAKCVIGKDYPRPIVDHKEASKENMNKMKAAYDAHKADKAEEQAAEKAAQKKGGSPAKRKPAGGKAGGAKKQKAADSDSDA